MCNEQPSFCENNLVSRVSHLTLPRGERGEISALAPGGAVTRETLAWERGFPEKQV